MCGSAYVTPTATASIAERHKCRTLVGPARMHIARQQSQTALGIVGRSVFVQRHSERGLLDDVQHLGVLRAQFAQMITIPRPRRPIVARQHRHRILDHTGRVHLRHDLLVHGHQLLRAHRRLAVRVQTVEPEDAALGQHDGVRGRGALGHGAKVARDLVHDFAGLAQCAVQPFEQERRVGEAAARIGVGSDALQADEVPVFDAVEGAACQELKEYICILFGYINIV